MTDNTPRQNQTLLIAIGIGTVAVVIAVIFIALLAGGGGDDKPAQTPAVLQGSEVTIDISDFDYSPRDATVTAGTSVSWANTGDAPHDAVDDGETWNTGVLDGGDTGSVTFDEAGVYDYHCSIHPDMDGKLTVTE